MKNNHTIITWMIAITCFINYTSINALKNIQSASELQTILAAKKPVVIKFYMDRCPACASYKKHFDAVAQTFKDKEIIFVEVPSTARALVQQYNVTGYPTTIIISKTGIQTFNKPGSISQEELHKQIQEIL